MIADVGQVDRPSMLSFKSSIVPTGLIGPEVQKRKLLVLLLNCISLLNLLIAIVLKSE